MSAWIPYAVAGGAVAVVTGVAIAFARPKKKKPKKPGRLFCPAEVGRSAPSRPADLAVGDFVGVSLVAGDEKSGESTWAVILKLGEKGDTRMWVRLVGAHSTVGPKPLLETHGFRLGQSLLVDWPCVWELFRPEKRTGLALCGQWGKDVALREPALFTPTTEHEVLVYIAPADPANPQLPGPGWDVEDPVWARIVSVSPGGSVMRVRILDEPENRLPSGKTAHGLEQGDELDVTRDCIFDTRKAEA